MSFDYNTLVTDRTEADVTARNTKGTYNFSDLNRVTAAMEDIHARLTGYGYATGYLSAGITWTESSEPTYNQMERYRTNVEKLRNALMMLNETPETPESMADLSWMKANNIEKILMDIDNAIIRMEQSRFYSAEIYSGEA